MSDAAPADLTEDEWRERLPPERFEVLRRAGTEPPGTGALLHHHDDGTYVCGACGNPLFASGTKFESGSGWPSFYDALPGSITEIEDTSHGMRRVEVRCARCGSHLGHVFPDGPRPTGQRYCMNSLALDFDPAEAAGETPI